MLTSFYLENLLIIFCRIMLNVRISSSDKPSLMALLNSFVTLRHFRAAALPAPVKHMFIALRSEAILRRSTSPLLSNLSTSPVIADLSRSKARLSSLKRHPSCSTK